MKPVVRAELQAALGGALAKAVPGSVYQQMDALAVEEALTAAAAEAVDNLRAGPVGDRAVELMGRLHAGLAERGVANGGDDAVTRALSTIDAFQTALDEAAQDQLEMVSEGLDAEQEIRAHAALAAHPPFGTKDRIEVIDEIAAYIRDGSLPEPRRRPPVAVS